MPILTFGNEGFAAVKQDIKLKTVVLDAGHGGTDPGAVSRDGKTKEKDLTLKISKLVGAKINAAYPDVKVVYTRPEDKFVTLQDRADIANKSQANLFISIHINSFTNANPDGFSTHILGESSKKDQDLFAYNMNVCKRENSVILLEDDYTTKYQGFDPNDPESFIFFHLMQNAFYEQSLLFAADVQSELEKGKCFQNNRGIHQDPFFVLWKTTMPSVLIENGFISNPKDLSVLKSDEGLDKIAESIFKAFAKFKDRYDGSTEFNKAVQSSSTAAKTTAESKPANNTKDAEKTTADSKPANNTKAAEKNDTEKKQDVVKAEPKKEVKDFVPASPDKTMYGIQVVASSKLMAADDPYFKGYPVSCHKSGNVYKYVICEQESEENMKKDFREATKKFPDAFMVKIEDERFTFWGRRP
ncbi:MAG: N-acetylmuramoyl-L-alanine amidase [Bacteroidales bacterium]|nr:N-acetylmuramoyl-L-alanine amidase [Candidatus Cryptobacteroides caccocaballi]